MGKPSHFLEAEAPFFEYLWSKSAFLKGFPKFETNL